MTNSPLPPDSFDHASAAQTADDFGRLAEQRGGGLLSDFWYFLKTNKKWWLTPILLALALIGLFILASSSVVAPFIYPLF